MNPDPIGPNAATAWQVIAFFAGAGLAHAVLAGFRSIPRRALASQSSGVRRLAAGANVVLGLGAPAAYLGAAALALGALGLSPMMVVGAAAALALSVAIGAPGVVRDVTTALALAFSNRLDAGTVAVIGGHVGTVERVDLRFTSLAGHTGTRVLVSNRAITDVVTYPAGYLSLVLDVPLPDDGSLMERALIEVRRVLDRSFAQFGQVMRGAPTVLARETTATGSYVRVELKLWPDQRAIVDTFLKPALAAALRPLTPGFKDWMIVAHEKTAGTGPVGRSDPRRHLSRRALLTRPWRRGSGVAL